MSESTNEYVLSYTGEEINELLGVVKTNKSFIDVDDHPLGILFGGTGAETPSDALKNFGIEATAEEISYMSGATDNIQAQINKINDIINNPDFLVPTVLYDDPAGISDGTITMKKSASEFSYIEIYYMTNDGEHLFTKVSNPDGKEVTLQQIKARSDASVYLKAKNVIISGDTITNSENNVISGEYDILGDGTLRFIENNCIYITKIVGYRHGFYSVV